MTSTDSITPGQHVQLDLAFGDTLTITDADGGRRGLLVCVNRGDHRERFSAPNTMLLNKSVYFGPGSTLYSYQCNPMMTIVGGPAVCGDTLPGPLVDGQYEDASARAALVVGLREVGLRPAQVPFPFQLLSHHDLDEDGNVGGVRSTSEPGSKVRLRAELDLVVVLAGAGGGSSTGSLSFVIDRADVEVAS